MKKTILTFKKKSGELIVKPKTKEDSIFIKQQHLKIAILIEEFNDKFGHSPHVFDKEKITPEVSKAAIIMARKILQLYNI